mmetsp:Transcript_72030/g.105570  ORF Transcript_72030/g.105570 Transcript_72030/m.105570 type:complete len:376 (-) Transcript_72030:40-1167(-)|eukprot:CAMPEP_0179462874 /NCGR_PEP_ID=MMETSP0799-20121207/45109_1 /TAXON_ID=46947 /ORGANISM="Geminigera cryophila, Strain CCMP2564" /LENGTH=375 /DNA_ID=CAMNT_0021265931 /DNA_START=117 /DNA_END=1244 /DNA_ORIENTATION=+
MATPIKDFGGKDRASSLQPAVGKLVSDLSVNDGYDKVPDMSRFKMLAGNSVPALAEKVAAHLRVPLMQVKCGRAPDGEIDLQLGESVRNTNVFVVQSTCPPVNENLMELFFITRCLRRASAKSITAVIPYFGYARQDRKMSARVPISASDVAMLLESAGVDRVLAVDLHCGQIQGFFHHTPVDNLSALRDFTPYLAREILKQYGDDPICIVSPDAGGVARAKQFLEALTTMSVNNISLAITVKHRSGPGEIEGMNVVGEIEGKHCIIVDDMIDTAGTLCKSAETLKEMGAKSVSACATHALFNGPALERIEKSVMEHVIISDTIPLNPKACAKIKVVSCAALLAEAIMCCQFGKSVSGLFDINDVSATPALATMD